MMEEYSYTKNMGNTKALHEILKVVTIVNSITEMFVVRDIKKNNNYKFCLAKRQNLHFKN